MLKRVIRHIIFPGIFPVFFFVIAATPVEVLGCYNRGMVALITALISAFLALGAALLALWRRSRGDLETHWFILSTLIFVIPAIGLIILA